MGVSAGAHSIGHHLVHPAPLAFTKAHPRVRGADCPVGPLPPGTRGPSLTGDHLDALERLYPDPVTGPSKRYKNAPGWLQARRAVPPYICPVLHTAHRLSCAGARVYLYEYAATSGPFGAASHGDQAPVVAHDMETLRGQRGLVAVAEVSKPIWRWARRRGVVGVWKGERRGCRREESEGVAVRKRILIDEEMAQCKFWWEKDGVEPRDGRERTI